MMECEYEDMENPKSKKNNKNMPMGTENSKATENGKNVKNSGKWTEEEHLRFLEGLRIHKKDWDRIAEHIGTRDAVHVRSHG